MKHKKSLLSNLFLLTAAVVWGMAFTTQKIAAAHIPPFSVNCIRFLMGGLVLIPVVLVLDRIFQNDRCLVRLTRSHPIDLTRAELLGGVLCGMVLFIAATLQQISLTHEHVGPGKASFLTALYVVFVPLLGLLRRKIAAANVWVSVVIAVVGAYMLTSGGIGSFALGGYDVLLLVSAFFFALHITVIDIFVPRVDPVRMSMLQFLTAGALGIPFMLFADPYFSFVPTGADILAAIPSMLYLGILSCAVGYTVQVIGQKISGTPTIASLIMSLESVVGLVGGVIILGEELNGYQLGGCAIIFFAVVLSQLPLREWIGKRKQAPDIPAAEAQDHTDAPPTE